MVILGINGYHKRSHDASACIIKDGRILAMTEEERLIRQKRAFDKKPLNSIKLCLEIAKINANNIEAIAIGFNAEDVSSPIYSSKIIEEILPQNLFNVKRNTHLFCKSPSCSCYQCFLCLSNATGCHFDIRWPRGK